MSSNETKFSKESATKLLVTRSFNATKDKVWRAWTQSRLLDQWWAPKPWKAETKEMNFTVGGHWLYAMVGPEGEKHWSKADYKTITQNGFVAKDAFCDENGVVTPDFPRAEWHHTFTANGDKTDVTIEINFENEQSMSQLLEMGFKEGFTMGLANLDELLETI